MGAAGSIGAAVSADHHASGTNDSQFWNLPSQDICSFLWERNSTSTSNCTSSAGYRHGRGRVGLDSRVDPIRCFAFNVSAATQTLTWCDSAALDGIQRAWDAADNNLLEWRPPDASDSGRDSAVMNMRNMGWLDLAHVVGVEAVSPGEVAEAWTTTCMLRLRLRGGVTCLLQATCEAQRREWLLRLPRLVLNVVWGRHLDVCKEVGEQPDMRWLCMEHASMLELALLGSAAMGQLEEVRVISACLQQRRRQNSLAESGGCDSDIATNNAMVAAAQSGAYDALQALLLAQQQQAQRGHGNDSVVSQAHAQAQTNALAVAAAFERLDCLEALLQTLPPAVRSAGPSAGPAQQHVWAHESALHVAAASGRMEALQLLLQAGFDAAARDPVSGMAAADMAMAHGYEACADMLRSHVNETVSNRQQRGGHNRGYDRERNYEYERGSAGSRQEQQEEEADPERVMLVVMAFLEALMNPQPRQSRRQHRRQQQLLEQQQPQQVQQQVACLAAPPPPPAAITWLLDADTSTEDASMQPKLAPLNHADLARDVLLPWEWTCAQEWGESGGEDGNDLWPEWEACQDEASGYWYWYCAGTGETVWDEGAPGEEESKGEIADEPINAADDWQARQDEESGYWYWYSSETGETVWDESQDDSSTLEGDTGQWEACQDEETGAWYWYCAQTGESAWDESDVNEVNAGINGRSGASDSQWELCEDEDSGAQYWYCAATDESEWCVTVDKAGAEEKL